VLSVLFREQKDDRLKRICRIGIVAIVILSLKFVPSGYFAVYPGPVTNLASMVDVSEHPPGDSSFYMVYVMAKDASVLDCIVAAFSRTIALWPKEQVLGGMTPEEYKNKNVDLMAESQQIAASTALRAQNIDMSEQGTFPVSVSIHAGEIQGPSAGLAFALEIFNRTGVDLLQGRRIACTGVLLADGSIQGVGGVAQKTIACEKEGIDIFVVPKVNYDEALRFARSVQIIGVSTFEEAVRALVQDTVP